MEGFGFKGEQNDEEIKCEYALPVKRLVVFPGSLVGFHINNPELIECMTRSWKLAVVPVIEGESQEGIGCLCELVRMDKLASKDVFFLFACMSRVKLPELANKDLNDRKGCLKVSKVELLKEEEPHPAMVKALKEKLQELIWRVNPNIAKTLSVIWELIPLNRLVDQIAYITSMSPKLKYELLKELNVELRAKKLIEIFEEMLEDYPIRHLKYKGKWLSVNVN